MNRKLPKNHGTCPHCKSKYFVRPFQLAYNTILLTKSQKEELAQFDSWCDLYVPSVVSLADRLSAVTSARIAGTGAAGAWATVRETAARSVVKDFPEMFQLLGTDGIERALAGEALLLMSWKAVPLVGMTRRDTLEVAVELRNRFGRLPSAGDIAWGCFNRAIGNPANHSLLIPLYHAQAMHLAAEGRPYAYVARQSWVVWAEQRRNIDGTVEVLPFSECPASKQAASRTYTIDEVLKSPPIPCDDCEASPLAGSGPGWCRCTLSIKSRPY